MHEHDYAEQITAGILAGGRARRMGGEDKGLVMLAGKPMIAYAIAALAQQTRQTLINANRNIERYKDFGCPVVEDKLSDFSGPLAGMASIMENTKTPYVLIVPCDSPLIPDDLAKRLHSELTQQQAEIAVAHDGQRMQPVFALLQRDLLPSMQQYLVDGGRKIDSWYALHHQINVDFSDAPGAFINVNTHEERDLLANMIATTSRKVNS